MENLATTKLSSKGQIVIPETIRKHLGLKEGVQFVVMGKGDAVILKVIRPPSAKEFDKIVGKIQRATKKANLKKKDLKAAIKKVRLKKSAN